MLQVKGGTNRLTSRGFPILVSVSQRQVSGLAKDTLKHLKFTCKEAFASKDGLGTFGKHYDMKAFGAYYEISTQSLFFSTELKNRSVSLHV